MHFKFIILLTVILSVFSIFLKLSNVRGTDTQSEILKKAAQKNTVFLNHFFKNGAKSAINDEPLRYYWPSGEFSDEPKEGKEVTERVKKFREKIERLRQRSQQDRGKQSTREYLLKDFKVNTKRPTEDIDDPIYILGDTYEEKITRLPFEGKALSSDGAESAGWSHDYWALAFGSLSFRYATESSLKGYEEAFNAYQQPKDFFQLRKKTNKKSFDAEDIDYWSPAEKYDLLIGDSRFTLTNTLKSEGLAYAEYNEADLVYDDGALARIEKLKKDVPTWMGKCHGWAAAATVVQKINKAVTLTGYYGDTIRFHADDIRGLITLKWAESPFDTNYAGGRCWKELAQIRKDEHSGAIDDQECFDVNPHAFRIILSNRIGLRKQSIVMDATFDAEVWNHPIRSYQVLSHFNPATGEIFGFDDKILQEAFALFGSNKDPFLKLREKKWQEAHKHNQRWIRYKNKNGKEFRPTWIVGETMAVHYLTETVPTHGRPYEDEIITVIYSYDLELDENGLAVGGEWYSNKHPDFLWAPADGARPKNDWDWYLEDGKVAYDGHNLEEIHAVKDEENDTPAAFASSAAKAPLATIIDYLIDQAKKK